MPSPNNPGRQGNRPPPVIAAQPAATPAERVSPVVAAAPAPPPLVEPKVVDGEATSPSDVPAVEESSAPVEPTPTEGAVDLGAIAGDLQRLAEGALAAVEVLPKPAAFVAVVPIFVGGEKGRVEPGESYTPHDAAERVRFLAQGVIRPA